MNKKIKEKIKTKSFWVTIAAAVVMLLKAFGLEMGEEIDRFADALCGILVAIGVLTSSSKRDDEENPLLYTEKTENSIIASEESLYADSKTE